MMLCVQGCSIGSNREESSNPLLNKIKNNESVSILINGDSIASSNGAQSWPQLVAQRLKRNYNLQNVYLSNISLPGNGAYAGYVIEKICVPENVDTYDLAILCYGQNDYDQENFPVYYEALIRATIEENPNVQILTILESSQGGYTDNIKIIEEISNYYGIPCVDTIKAFSESGYSMEELTTDLVHPNELGNDIYAETTIETLKNQVFTEEFKQKPLPDYLYKETAAYEYFRYVKKESMIAENSGFSFVVNDGGCAIGIDQIYKTGENKLKLMFNGNTYDLDYDWVHDFEQRHIDKLDINGEDSERKLLITGAEQDLDRLNGVVLTDNSKLSGKTDYESVLAQQIKAEQVMPEKILQFSILDEEANLQSVENGFADAQNYFVGVYAVHEGEYLDISSKSIGNTNEITRYAFYQDISGQHLIEAGCKNTGGWTDEYLATEQVPKNANYVFVTCQNNSEISVSYSNEKRVKKEIAPINIYPNCVLSADGNVYGEDINKDYGNYSIYLYDVTGMDTAEVDTNAIGNPDAFMIFALSDVANARNFTEKGRLNSAGWNETPKVKVHIPQEDNILYVLCQNGTVPVVVVSN